MRYFFIIVFSFMLVTACSDEYAKYGTGDNLVVGVWNNYYEDTDSLVITRVFTADYYSYFSYSDGKYQDEENKQHYSISHSTLILEKYNQTFRIKYDSLWITNSSKDKITKYVRKNNFDTVLE